MQTWDLFRCDASSDRLVRVTVTAANLRSLGGDGVRKEGVIFVASATDAHDVVAALTDGAPVGRRSKNPAKGLKDCIPARVGICHVHAAYVSPGKLEAGVRSLSRAEEYRRWRGVFLLEITSALFERMRALVGPSMPELATYSAWAREGGAGRLREVVEARYDHEPIPDTLTRAFVGDSVTAHCVRRMAYVAAREDCPVLILGESGTGKEIVARQIHALSERKGRLFMPVNCAAIPTELLESELFGHAPGAFTGADRETTGLVGAAGKGTLFMDEVGDLSPSHQAKVLRLLEDGEYRKVGSTRTERNAARVIAATNRDLASMVRDGRFREDLLYRLYQFIIRTPALRDHPEDVPALVRHFWDHVRPGAALPAAVVDLLASYPWRGNARELKSFLHYVAALAIGQTPHGDLIAAAFGEWTGVATAPADR